MAQCFTEAIAHRADTLKVTMREHMHTQRMRRDERYV